MRDRVTLKRLVKKAESMSMEFGLKLVIDHNSAGYMLCRVNTPGSRETDLTDRMSAGRLLDVMIAMCTLQSFIKEEPERFKRETEYRVERDRKLAEENGAKLGAMLKEEGVL